MSLSASLFLQIILDLVEKSNPGSQSNLFSIDPKTQDVSYVSEGFLIQRKDEILSELTTGKLPFSSFRSISSALPQLFPTVDDAQRYFKSCIQKNEDGSSAVHLYSQFVVSDIHIDNMVKEAFQCLRREGRVQLKVSLDFCWKYRLRIFSY
jgi:hypothetical protein